MTVYSTVILVGEILGEEGCTTDAWVRLGEIVCSSGLKYALGGLKEPLRLAVSVIQNKF